MMYLFTSSSVLLFVIVISLCAGVECRHASHSRQPQSLVEPSGKIDEGKKVDLITVPMTAKGYPAEYYTIDSTIGTPAQPYRLTVGYNFEVIFFGSVNDWTPLLFAGNISASCDGKQQPQRQVYNCNASTSCILHDSWGYGWGESGTGFVMGCDTDISLQGANALDTVNIANFSMSAVNLYISNVTGPLNPAWQSDGMFNFELHQLVQNVRNPLVGFYLGSGTTSSGATMTIGGGDPNHCPSTWHWTEYMPVTCDFCFNIVDIKIGQTSIIHDNVQLTTPALMTPITYVTQNVFDGIVQAVDAEYDSSTDTYNVPCSYLPMLPPMNFTMNEGYVFSMSASDYARPTTSDPSQCSLLFAASTQLIDSIQLGSAFFKDHCILNDLQEMRVGFAPVIR